MYLYEISIIVPVKLPKVVGTGLTNVSVEFGTCLARFLAGGDVGDFWALSELMLGVLARCS